ncbi:MAG: twin-arginine translocase subunit TatB [Acidimicrobiia bacterium]
MLNVGPLEILLIVVIALLVIGPEDLPDAVRKVGRFFAELRRYGEEVQEEVRAIIEDAASGLEDDLKATEPSGGSDLKFDSKNLPDSGGTGG